MGQAAGTAWRALLGSSLALLAGGVIALSAPPDAVAATGEEIELHAHRGAPLENGDPIAPENSLSAAERAAERHSPDFVELDVKYTSDGVPVNLHDATLDRTTTCTGRVDAITLTQLRTCLLDKIGTGAEGSATLQPIPNPTETVPTLEEMLDFSERTGVKLNVEIKNVPTDSDFIGVPATAVDPIIDLIHARGMLSRRHVLIQSFWFPDLDRAAARIADLVPDPAQRPLLHFLTLQASNEGAINFAATSGYDGLGPQWPPLSGEAEFVQAASARGLRVVPYTLNEAEEIESALASGVDGVITDDMAVANRVTGRDRGRLRLNFAARSPQRGLRRIRARVACRGAACKAVVRTRVRVNRPGRPARVFRGSVRPWSADLRADRPRGVRVSLPRKARRAGRRALRQDGSVVARVRAQATDRSGEQRRRQALRIAVRR
jgi:glycerophosphoryl diester phosphodiesterase